MSLLDQPRTPRVCSGCGERDPMWSGLPRPGWELVAGDLLCSDCLWMDAVTGYHAQSNSNSNRLEGDSRLARVDTLTPGDFIEIHDGYGEVTRIRGPHGPLGTPATSDWYTLQVMFEDERSEIHGVIPKHPDTVGPLKGDREVVCWS